MATQPHYVSHPSIHHPIHHVATRGSVKAKAGLHVSRQEVATAIGFLALQIALVIIFSALISIGPANGGPLR